MMHELFVLDNIVLTYVLFHKYPTDIQSKGNVMVDKKKNSLMTMENITLVIDPV